MRNAELAIRCYSALRIRHSALETSAISFFQGFIQVGGIMGLAVVFDFLVTLHLDDLAALQLEAVGGVLEVLVLHQHALEGLGVEAEGGAALEAPALGVKG